jgi:hypothetical protein
VVQGREIFSDSSRFATVMDKDVFRFLCRVSRSLVTKLIEASLEPGSQLFCRPSPPIVEEDNNRLLSDHVVMDRYYI